MITTPPPTLRPATPLVVSPAANKTETAPVVQPADQFQRVVQQLKADPHTDARALDQLNALAGTDDVALFGLSRDVRAQLRRALPDSVAAVLADEVHPGVANPFNFARLAKPLSPELETALATYVNSNFPYARAAQKTQVLDAIEPLLCAGGATELRRLHLPQHLNGDPQAAILTYALEAEVIVAKRPLLLNFYAPAQDGRLDAAVMDDLLGTLETDESLFSDAGLKVVKGAAWLRMDSSQRARSLRWKSLSERGRVRYLGVSHGQRGSWPPLYRIEDPRVAPGGKVLSDTMREQVKWEAGAAELITAKSYSSLDTLYADFGAIEGMRREGERPNGYHVHIVTELPSHEDRAGAGVAMVNLFALEDLELFTYGAAAATGLEHANQVPWRGDAVRSVVEHFAAGECDPDFFAEHKFHQVGLRGGIYGSPFAVGAENRGVLIGDFDFLMYNIDRHSRTLVDGGLEKVPPDLFASWRAGDPALITEAFEAARADPRFAKIADASPMTYDDLFSVAMDTVKESDPFVLASPLWNFEDALPLSPQEARTVGEARLRFTHTLETLFENLDRDLRENTELDDQELGTNLRVAVCKFFEESRLDRVIGKYLDGFAYPERS